MTRDDPEWAAAMSSLTVSEKVKTMPSRRQHKENERDCRTVVQQLISSIPQCVLMRTSYKQKEIRTQRRTVTFKNSDQKWEKLKKNRNKKVCPGRRTSKKVV